MKTIIIAAGFGSRLKDLTKDTPKCLLDVGGKSIIQHQLDAYKENGISDISIIKGYLADKISIPNVSYFFNDNFPNNNILGSLFYAESSMNEGFIASYSDIVFEPWVVTSLQQSTADITIVVDTDWKEYYEGRTDHPIEQAEAVMFDEHGQVLQIGKGITPENISGEFIGMLKCSKKGAEILKEYFHKARDQFSGKPFVRAETFEKAYITDLIQYMVYNGVTINCVSIKQGWYEIDTEQDLEKVREIYSSRDNEQLTKENSEKTVYVALGSDTLHHGHINIINEARKLGKLTIGLLTDEAIASYKRAPTIAYEQRKRVIENIKGVHQVIPQHTKEYTDNLMLLKPDFVVHGDEWKNGILKDVRANVINTLTQWGGKLVEPKYTEGYSTHPALEQQDELGITPYRRLKKLRTLLKTKELVRILEAHNGLTGLIVEKTKIESEQGGIKEFDGMWLSSLTHSTSKGKPDIMYVDNTQMAQTISEIFEIGTKPMIVDADNGGLKEHFALMVKTMERLGVSAVIIEDKVGLKKNSLFGTAVKQTQDDIHKFCEKITFGKQAQHTNYFMIIARIESLILKAGLEDAVKRAKAYIEAGADGIMIHSKEKSSDEILAFCKEFAKFEKKVPLVVVPSTYSHITERELIDAGVNVVIYANHLLRSAFPAMVNAAKSILSNNRCHEASEQCMPIKEILTLIPGGK